VSFPDTQAFVIATSPRLPNVPATPQKEESRTSPHSHQPTNLPSTTEQRLARHHRPGCCVADFADSKQRSWPGRLASRPHLFPHRLPQPHPVILQCLAYVTFQARARLITGVEPLMKSKRAQPRSAANGALRPRRLARRVCRTPHSRRLRTRANAAATLPPSMQRRRACRSSTARRAEPAGADASARCVHHRSYRGTLVAHTSVALSARMRHDNFIFLTGDSSPIARSFASLATRRRKLLDHFPSSRLVAHNVAVALFSERAEAMRLTMNPSEAAEVDRSSA